jgi:hypothetical protein
MSSKVEKPTLQGQRIKTRKRDEKEKYDPNTFRDLILQGVQEILQNSFSVSKEPPTAQAGNADQLVSAVAAVQITDASKTDSSSADAANPTKSIVDATSNTESSSFDTTTDTSSNIAATASAETSDDDSTEVSRSESTINSTTRTCEVGASRNIHFERSQFEALSKLLDVSGSKLNYRRYGDVLLDIIIAGGILGTIFFIFIKQLNFKTF